MDGCDGTLAVSGCESYQPFHSVRSDGSNHPIRANQSISPGALGIPLAMMHDPLSSLFLFGLIPPQPIPSPPPTILCVCASWDTFLLLSLCSSYPLKRSKKDDDGYEEGVMGNVSLLQNVTFSTQPISSMDWSPDKVEPNTPFVILTVRLQLDSGILLL